MRVQVVDGTFVIFTDYAEREKARSVGAQWSNKAKLWVVQANVFAAEKLLRLGVEGADELRGYIARQNVDVPRVVPKTKLPLMDHQVVMVSRLLAKRRYCFFPEMGTGKTGAVIGAAQELFGQGKLDLAIIVAPLSVLASWERQIEKFCAVPYRTLMVTGTATNRTNRIEDVTILRKSMKKKRLLFALINYEALDKWLADLLEMRAGLVCFDETNKIKNHSAKMTKASFALSDHAEYVVGLTGTPISNNISELWSQCRAVSKGFFGAGSGSYWEFVYDFCVMGGWKGKQVVGTKNLDRLDALLKSFSYRVRKDEVLDLPGRTWVLREVSLSGSQLTAYKKAEQEFYFGVDAVKRHTGEHAEYAILIRNALGRLLRCQQIAAGHVRDEHGNMATWPDNPKLAELLEVVREAGDQKVVVFSRFVEDLEAARVALEKLKVPAAVYHGGVSQGDRAVVERRFLDKKDSLKVLLVQVQTGGLGVDFSSASVCVFYTNWFSWGVRDQAESRVHRLGQTRNVLYVDLIARESVDGLVLDTVMNKRSLSEVLFGKALPIPEEVAP
jgi:SNF2 family DNA or RNA helicase